ncbi:hypothetical protein ACHWQZ_G011644 [Mnemiopsis leidyi]
MSNVPKSKVHKDAKGRIILDEEKYVECLDHIIERDFFPDLKKLRRDTGCLPAESERVDLSNETFDTPILSGGGELSTPSRGSKDNAAVLSAPVRADSNLDSFLNKHTSEDNASYSEIVEEEVAKNKEKANSLYAPSLEYKPDLAAIGYHENGKLNKPPDGWNFKRKNELLFPPEGLMLKDKDNPNFNRQIVHSNTGLPNSVVQESLAKKLAPVISKDKIGVDGKPLDGNATPRVKGYAYCATPQIEPGVGASPLMTWGEVESTPQRLEGATPSRPTGPAFKIPQVPEKDRLGHALADRVNKRHKQRHDKAMTAMKKLANSAGLTPSPLRDLSGLSPAARRLALATTSMRSSSARSNIFSNTPSKTTPARTPGWDSPRGSWTPSDTPDTSR